MSQALARTLVRHLAVHSLEKHHVIQWSSPVFSFGDPRCATVATLGLNPSNREFVDRDGNELDGPGRRFPTLRSLGLRSWAAAGRADLRHIYDACCGYFGNNPYDAWFRRLDALLRFTGTSYYGAEPRACHLDLVPYATTCKWGSLDLVDRRALLTISAPTLGLALRESRIRLLVLNGASVVHAFERVAGAQLRSRRVPAWDLPRHGAAVAGVGYTGRVTMVGGVRVGREVLVCGYNHNIQSSFGVTRDVTLEIANWLGRKAGESQHEQR